MMPHLTKEYRWCVLYTRPNHEVKAESYLKNCNLDVFLPRKEVLHQWVDRKKLVKELLFPCYVFVRLSIREYEKALQHYSIVYCVKCGGSPCCLPDDQIETIKALIKNKISLEVSNDHFEPGDMVEIVSGPLISTKAEVVQRKGKEELILRLDCINQNIVIITSCRYIRVPEA